MGRTRTDLLQPALPYEFQIPFLILVILSLCDSAFLSSCPGIEDTVKASSFLDGKFHRTTADESLHVVSWPHINMHSNTFITNLSCDSNAR